MLCSVLLSMASCNLFKKRIDSGTEAAKLLLANERLDENLIGAKIDIGMNSDAQSSAYSSQEKSPTASLMSYYSSKSSNVAAASSESLKTWSSFSSGSISMDESTQFMGEIENRASNAASAIALMKNDVGVTDKWVNFSRSSMMLRVYENSDVLFYLDDLGGINVYYRYTDDNAKNVYEIYRCSTSEDGYSQIKFLLVPGERYEYMYTLSDDSGDLTDYFIAENSRGYWVSTRFDVFIDNESNTTGANFFSYIIKDGLGFGGEVSIHNNGEGDLIYNSDYKVFDPVNNRELFAISDDGWRYTFDLYISAIKNGFVSVSANESDCYEYDGIYQTYALSSLTTKNGVYTAITDDLPENQFAFTSGYVQYFFGEQIYFGSVDFTMINPQMTLDAACEEFGTFANSLGLQLYCDMDTVAASVEHAALFMNNFTESFEWNGYKMSSAENIKAAKAVLQEQYDKAMADYEAVKSFETSDTKQTLSKNAHFAALQAAANGNNTFDGTEVTLSGVSVSTSDVALFEEGKEYVLKVGLSLLDENGNPISVNTVALDGTDPTPVIFNGGSIALQTSGTYQIPKSLDSGNYAAVVYIATKDEGIRVSEIQKIAFLSINEGEIESSAMHVEAIEQDSNLIIKYEIKNKHDITITATKAAYSYDEIKRIIMIEILSYGAPYHGAVLEYSSGEAVDEGASLGKGTYRMMCYLVTKDGLAQSYVYLTVE